MCLLPCWLFVSFGFDEISEAVFEARTSLTEKAKQERKRLQNAYTPMLRTLSCVLLTVTVSCGRLQMHGMKSKVQT